MLRDLKTELREQKKETCLAHRATNQAKEAASANLARATAAESRIKGLETELEKSKAEVESVKRKADVDMAPVLAALQKKRKAEEAEVEPQVKKTKM